MTTATADIANDTFTALREFLSMENRTAHYPVAIPVARELADAYRQLPGALQPLALRKFSTVQFPKLSDVDKLTQVYRELDGANSCGTVPPTVPASWVAWLLAQYDSLHAITG
jgi:hypothetical protein